MVLFVLLSPSSWKHISGHETTCSDIIIKFLWNIFSMISKLVYISWMTKVKHGSYRSSDELSCLKEAATQLSIFHQKWMVYPQQPNTSSRSSSCCPSFFEYWWERCWWLVMSRRVLRKQFFFSNVFICKQIINYLVCPNPLELKTKKFLGAISNLESTS